MPDATVIGSGPNGLAAAIRLAERDREVAVYEAATTPGGGARSAELTLPGFVHDPFAAVFALAAASPYFRSLELNQFGLNWIEPPIPLAHPLDNGTAVTLHRSVEQTADGLGPDRDVYLELMRPLVAGAELLISDILAPPWAQRHPRILTRFGPHAVRSATGFACSYFHGDAVQALLAGNAAHSFLALESPLTAGFGLFLMLLGHAVGWPIAQGGAGNVSAALISRLRSLGGTLLLDRPVQTLREIPSGGAVLFDTDPRQMASIAGSHLPDRFRSRLRRHRYGPGAFKLDYALDGPVPWTAPECLQAGTVHVGGSLEEIARSESDVSSGRVPGQPFVLVCQPSLFDATRAPRGRHTLWAYCHVPSGTTVDMTERIERQIERFAPGFRDRILARHVMTPHDLESANANLVGGAINGGVQDFWTFLRWVLARPSPYATPNPNIFRCSAATAPGGGVHGMSGYHAAEFALRHNRSPWGRKRAGPASV